MGAGRRVAKATNTSPMRALGPLVADWCAVRVRTEDTDARSPGGDVGVGSTNTARRTTRRVLTQKMLDSAAIAEVSYRKLARLLGDAQKAGAM